MAPIAVIPGRLLWAPEAASNAGLEGCVVVSAMDLLPGVGSDLYAVPHYPKEALGRAFGPVALDKQLEFCYNLLARIGEASCGGEEDAGRSNPLALTTPPNNVQSRANVATMLGTYLILRHGWPASKVRKVLGKEDAERLFACAWSRANRPEGKRHHRVHDCWSGIELARQLEWINPVVVYDEKIKAESCRRYRELALRYDAAWVVPGRIVVCADPVSTAIDPNPATFKKVFPDGNHFSRAATEEAKIPGAEMVQNRLDRAAEIIAADASRLNRRRPSVNSNNTSNATTPRSHASSAFHSWGSVWSSKASDTMSTDTVCKTDVTPDTPNPLDFEGNEDVDNAPEDFVTFLKEAGVRVMIRCNFDDEPGMPESGGYDAKGIEDNGIKHEDIIVPDYDGGLPTRKGCRGALELVGPVLGSSEMPNAVAVHCKGGFGRSMVLACCLAIDHYDIPGDALMGWVRISRPGAITTPIQERFLKQMKDRRCLRKWAGVPLLDDDEEGAAQRRQPTCQMAGCSLM